jgi:hypothetical protein
MLSSRLAAYEKKNAIIPCAKEKDGVDRKYWQNFELTGIMYKQVVVGSLSPCLKRHERIPEMLHERISARKFEEMQ